MAFARLFLFAWAVRFKEPLYDGLFPELSRSDKTFRISINEGLETVSIIRGTITEKYRS